MSKHNLDLTDSVTQATNVLLLSEIWGDESTTNDIPNFNYISKFKRAAGEAIYKNYKDSANVITPYFFNIQITGSMSEICARVGHVGDICSAICKLENGIEVVIVVVYISPNKKN